RAAMIDPRRRRTSDAPSLAAIRARTTKQTPSHSPYGAYSQACSHRARKAGKTARGYAGNSAGGDRGSIFAAGVFKIVGVERPAPAWLIGKLIFSAAERLLIG